MKLQILGKQHEICVWPSLTCGRNAIVNDLMNFPMKDNAGSIKREFISVIMLIVDQEKSFNTYNTEMEIGI